MQRLVMDAPDQLAHGSECYRRRAWAEAYRSLSLADRSASLDAEDLERLATAAYLIGRDEDSERAWERAHHAHQGAGDPVRSARCAFWLGLGLFLRGEPRRAGGWLARAGRLLERRDCVEQGYLRLPEAEQKLAAGDHAAALAAAEAAELLGERYADADLVCCARHLKGRILLYQGRTQQGLALLDEVMVAVTTGELTPVVTGLVYCSVLGACQQTHALDHARQWTESFARWCAEQPELVAFTATCLVLRAEVLQLSGDWADATEEARRACARLERGAPQKPPAAAFYQQAELHRLRGEFAAAEECYRRASRGGREPQPGLALLRLAQGRARTAAAAMRRIVKATAGRMQRARLLPAHVEILLAAGEVPEARAACRELDAIAAGADRPMLSALAAQSRGAVELAERAPESAIASLRLAWQTWERIGAPYAAARVRELMGHACRALGDHDGARLELDAARATFERLGAAPDQARLEALIRGERTHPHGLTPRELEVLRLVATGKTNKAIALALFVSERTVDRHLSNILTKLAVPSRAAATAYAYEHELI